MRNHVLPALPARLTLANVDNVRLLLCARSHTVFEKHWREVIPRTVIDEFWSALQKEGGPAAAPPSRAAGRYVMMHAARGPLLLVGALAKDVPALMVFELLHRVGDLLELYLKELSEDALRANFVTVYQLLDEIIDNGVPLHTEPNVLEELVMRPGKMESMVASVTGASQVRGNSGATISWGGGPATGGATTWSTR